MILSNKMKLAIANVVAWAALLVVFVCPQSAQAQTINEYIQQNNIQPKQIQRVNGTFNVKIDYRIGKPEGVVIHETATREQLRGMKLLILTVNGLIFNLMYMLLPMQITFYKFMILIMVFGVLVPGLTVGWFRLNFAKKIPGMLLPVQLIIRLTLRL